jgi:hypothetical protein
MKVIIGRLDKGHDGPDNGPLNDPILMGSSNSQAKQTCLPVGTFLSCDSH